MMINVLVKKPGKEPEAIEIENELEPFQKAVGGFIEVIRPFPEEYHLLLICNEEGKWLNLRPNIVIGTEIIVGTVLIVRENGEEFASLTEQDMKTALAHLESYINF